MEITFLLLSYTQSQRAALRIVRSLYPGLLIPAEFMCKILSSQKIAAIFWGGAGGVRFARPKQARSLLFWLRLKAKDICGLAFVWLTICKSSERNVSARK
jgi:hypothetical protein